MAKQFVIVVAAHISCDTLEQAMKVVEDKFSYNEDLGFEYNIDATDIEGH